MHPLPTTEDPRPPSPRTGGGTTPLCSCAMAAFQRRWMSTRKPTTTCFLTRDKSLELKSEREARIYVDMLEFTVWCRWYLPAYLLGRLLDTCPTTNHDQRSTAVRDLRTTTGGYGCNVSSTSQHTPSLYLLAQMHSKLQV